MENTVTMALKDYDHINDKAREYEQAAKDAAREMASLKIFRIEKTYNGSLEIKLTDDAIPYLNKAFASYAADFELRPLNNLSIWNCAEAKSKTVEESPEILQ